MTGVIDWVGPARAVDDPGSDDDAFVPGSSRSAADDLCSVRVDCLGRILHVAFTDRIAESTATRLTASVLETYVTAAAEAASWSCPPPPAADLADDRLERVTGSSATRLVRVTMTASGRLRRVGFHQRAVATTPAALGDAVRQAIDEASTHALRAAGLV
jgi:DNA-binding protein YbaB